MAGRADSIFASEDAPIFAAVEAERRATAALAALLATDHAALEAAASMTAAEAARTILSTRPASISGSAALLGFVCRYLLDDPEMPPSVRRIITAVGNVEACLLGELAAKTCPQH